MAVTAFVSSAQGQVADTWKLSISEKELQLAHGSDPMWMKSLMWDISYSRMWARSMPTLELINLQPAGGPDITQFQMTIGDPRFHFASNAFGSLVTLGTTTPGYTLTSSTSNNDDLLTINIAKDGGGGLKPGELVRFSIGLGVDDGFNFFDHPDFRTVLFDMNSAQPYGPNPNAGLGAQKNATVNLKFSDNTTAGPKSFPDFTVTDQSANFFNDTFRPYGIMEPVNVFMIGGGGPGDPPPDPVIPEPSSAMLAALALAIAGPLLRRQRRAIV